MYDGDANIHCLSKKLMVQKMIDSQEEVQITKEEIILHPNKTQASKQSSIAGDRVPESNPLLVGFTEEKRQRRREFLLDDAESLRLKLEDYRHKVRTGRYIRVFDTDSTANSSTAKLQL